MHGIKWLHPGLKVLCDAGTCQMMHGSMHWQLQGLASTIPLPMHA